MKIEEEMCESRTITCFLRGNEWRSVMFRPIGLTEVDGFKTVYIEVVEGYRMHHFNNHIMYFYFN